MESRCDLKSVIETQRDAVVSAETIGPQYGLNNMKAATTGFMKYSTVW